MKEPRTSSSAAPPRRVLAWLLPLTWLPACGPAEPVEMERTRPSVLLVSIDTLRADHVGFHGYERDTTPFLDRLAQRGLVFERAMTPCAWTLVAHMSMLTGLYPDQHGVLDEDVALAPEVPLLAEVLRELGYQTVALYFPGYVHERFGFDRGFDVFRSHSDAEEAGRHLHESLAELDPERPLFLFLHLFDVHSDPFLPEERAVYRSPAPYQEHFVPDALARMPEASAREIWEGTPPLDAHQLEGLVGMYDAGIRYVDAKLEAWFGELEAQGWLEHALIVVTSDHGEALGQRGGKLSGHGGTYQEGLHVPLLVLPPVEHSASARAGERIPHPVSLVDIAPTILDAVGLPPSADSLGYSLLGQLPAERTLAGSRAGSAYFLVWPRKYLRQGPVSMGYDLEADPGELVRRRIPREAYDEVRAELFGKAASWAGIPIDGVEGEELEALRDLGYLGGDED